MKREKKKKKIQALRINLREGESRQPQERGLLQRGELTLNVFFT